MAGNEHDQYYALGKKCSLADQAHQALIDLIVATLMRQRIRTYNTSPLALEVSFLKLNKLCEDWKRGYIEEYNKISPTKSASISCGRHWNKALKTAMVKYTCFF